MKKICTLVLMLVLSTSLIYSQSFSIGPQIGIVKTSNADKGTILPNLAARLNLVGLTVEGSVGYKSDEYESGAIKMKSYPLQLTGMIGVFPFIHAEAGIGWYNTKIQYSGIYSSLSDETKSQVAYHAGLGTDISLGSFMLTGDIRYVFHEVEINNVLDLTKLKTNYYVIYVGLLYTL